MAYSCPAKGCTKRGNRSSLHQHFAAKHADLAKHYDWAHVDLFIQTGRTITMPITIEKDTKPGTNRFAFLVITVAFIVGFAAGAALYHVAMSPDFRIEMSSPPAISKPDKR